MVHPGVIPWPCGTAISNVCLLLLGDSFLSLPACWHGMSLSHGVSDIPPLVIRVPACVPAAVGERNPQLALRINTAGIQNILDLAATHNLQVCGLLHCMCNF